MKNDFLIFFIVAASVGLAAAQSKFQVNTPAPPIECVPTLITWTSGGQSPYTLTIQEPDANGTPVQVYPGLTDTSFSWSTNITAGQSIGITVRDATGAPAQSGSVIIQPGASTDCIGAASGSSAPAAGSSTSAASTGATSSAGAASSSGSSVATSVSSGTGSPSVSRSTAPASSGSGSGSTSSASPSPTGGSSGGAMSNAAAMGAVGFIGAVVAAIMA